MFGTAIGLGLLNYSKGIKVYDSFNRTNNITGLGKADTGQDWLSLNGIFGISENQAYWVSGVGNCATVVDSKISDCILQATYRVPVLNARLYLRTLDINNTFLIGYVGTGKAYEIYRRQSAVSTLIATGGIAEDGDQIKVLAIGNSIKMYKNEILLLSVVDSFNQNETKHGLGVYNSDDVASSRFDNFSVGVL